jgi:hypothetical protein
MTEMPVWMTHLLSGLIGAMATGIGMTIFIVGRLSKVETRLDGLDDLVAENRTHTDNRIFEIQSVAKEVMQLAREVIKQNDILIAEIRAMMKVVK